MTGPPRRERPTTARRPGGARIGRFGALQTPDHNIHEAPPDCPASKPSRGDGDVLAGLNLADCPIIARHWFGMELPLPQNYEGAVVDRGRDHMAREFVRCLTQPALARLATVAAQSRPAQPRVERTARRWG